MTDFRFAALRAGEGETPTGAEVLAFQARLAEQYGYRPVPLTLDAPDVRALYRRWLPGWCRETGADKALCTAQGTCIASGYGRVVIGDYGAFLEISPSQAFRAQLRVAPGQEYRIRDPHFVARCKYDWLTARDGSGCKIYYQTRAGPYADYRPGFLYVSPYEAAPQGQKE